MACTGASVTAADTVPGSVLCGLLGIGETLLAGGGCCSSQPPGSSSLFHLPLPLFRPPPPPPLPPLQPPPILSSDIGSPRAGEKAPPRRRTQGATSGDAAGLVSTADASMVMPSGWRRTLRPFRLHAPICCCWQGMMLVDSSICVPRKRGVGVWEMCKGLASSFVVANGAHASGSFTSVGIRGARAPMNRS